MTLLATVIVYILFGFTAAVNFFLISCMLGIVLSMISEWLRDDDDE